MGISIFQLTITKDGVTVDLHTYEHQLLRVPAAGAYGDNVFSVPVNNIILRNKNNDTIEFTSGIIDVNRKTNIKKTPLAGRNVTVKELMSTQDFIVIITAKIIASQGVFPYKELKLLNHVLSDVSLDVTSSYLDCFGINKMVLEEMKFNQKDMKYLNAMPVDLKFLSDSDYDFLIIDD